MITFLVPRAALALLLTLASWVPLGPNEGCKGRLYAFAPGLPMRQAERGYHLHPSWARAVRPPHWVHACLLGAYWPQQRVHRSTVCLCPWPANASVFVPACHLCQELAQFFCSKRKHDVDATSTPPGREPPGRPIASTVPHLLIDSRPGPKSGVECRLTILLLLLHCHVLHSVRVPALSVGAGEGNLLAHQRRLEVPKLNGDQVTDGKQVPILICGIHVSRDLLRELAIELFDMAKHYPCTCVPFVSFRYPRRV